MKQFIFATTSLLIASATLFLSCKKDTAGAGTTTNATLPDVFKKFNTTVTISVEGNYVVLKSTGIPDHKSPYFATTNAQYEAYNGTNPNYAKNPNSIQSQSYVFKIPVSPVKASASTTTPLGPMGISINGVPLFNQYAAGNAPLTNEVNSFDQYNGHPQQTGQYHYHVEPLFITQQKGRNALIGFLLDGYPVYGPMENGSILTTSQLDGYHGHFAVTADYPNGIYHYHITADAPYINGNGFYGTPGTVTQ
ncbi:MAG: YHYH protein [Sediminibacterium sp.]|nr:YHYH protein [uncultured Sediminibacterium sp.]